MRSAHRTAPSAGPASSTSDPRTPRELDRPAQVGDVDDRLPSSSGRLGGVVRPARIPAACSQFGIVRAARRASRPHGSARRHRSADCHKAPRTARRLIQHRVEHRREVAGRAVDDLQYLGGRGLLLQGLARLGDQPRILHRDDRLRGEILQQRDLLCPKTAGLPGGRTTISAEERARPCAARRYRTCACPPSSTTRCRGHSDRSISARSAMWTTSLALAPAPGSDGVRAGV